MSKVFAFLKDESGATAIEYGLIAALIFGLHPALIESVAWISGVTDPLLAVCLVPAFLAFLNWREGRAPRWLAASLVLYALALMSKEPAIVLGPLISLASSKWTGLLLWWKPFKADDVATLKELPPGDFTRSLDPNFDMWATAEPILREIPGATKARLSQVFGANFAGQRPITDCRCR